MATWNPLWPAVLLEKSVDIKSPFLRTNFESGTVRNRRWFTAVPARVEARVIFCDPLQSAAFESWFKADLNYGAEPFTIDLLIGGVKQTRTVQFEDMYRIQVVSKTVNVYTLPLTILNY